jgi:hypothetical protein
LTVKILDSRDEVSTLLDPSLEGWDVGDYRGNSLLEGWAEAVEDSPKNRIDKVPE